MQNINKELSLCSQLGTDAQPEACFSPFEYCSENESLQDHRATFAFEKVCQTFFILFASSFTVNLGLQAIRA